MQCDCTFTCALACFHTRVCRHSADRRTQTTHTVQTHRTSIPTVVASMMIHDNMLGVKYMLMYIYMYMYMYMCVDMDTRSWIYGHVYVCMCMCLCMYICTCVVLLLSCAALSRQDATDGERSLRSATPGETLVGWRY